MAHQISEYAWRRVVSRQAALSFFVRMLLRNTLASFSKEEIEQYCQTLRESAGKTGQFEGMTKGDDIRSEELSDLVVLAQSDVVAMVDEAEKAVLEKKSGTRPQGT